MDIQKLKKGLNPIKRNLRWILLILSTILVIIIIENLFQNEIGRFDNAVYQAIAQIIREPITSVLKVITNIGGAICVVAICILTLLVLQEKRYGIYMTFNLLIITISNFFLKNIFERPRPTGFRLIEETGYSFPSGHSMVSMAFYGFIVYLIYQHVKNPYLKWSLCILLSLLIILIGISRIYLGVHYASDVAGGFCISIAYLTLFTKVYKENMVSENNK